MFGLSIKSLVAFLPLYAVSVGSPAWESRTTTIDVQFVAHSQAGFPELDVFVEHQGISADQVMRVEGDEAKDPSNRVRMTYASQVESPHDPFKLGPHPLGPLPKGRALGFTLEQWLAARGGGTYAMQAETAELNLSFTNLIPNGVYTLWCTRFTFPPNFNTVTTPCGAPDGSQNTLKADAQGNARFHLKLKTLPETDKETATILILTYHSDSMTHGPTPGGWGSQTHAQLFYIMPPPTAGGI